jgi:hypothetical protein
MVAGIMWWQGTKNYDFLAPPPPEEIAFARMRAAGELATPSDLFAVEPIEEVIEEPIAPPAPPPEPPAPVPMIDPGDLGGEHPLDAWVEHSDKPAASFINLASSLEAKTEFRWALLAWERVLDQTSASGEEQKAALNGVRRLRATLPPWNENPKDATRVTMVVHAPKDRRQLAKRAADRAAKIVGEASSGLIEVSTGAIRESPPTAASPKLRVILMEETTETPPEVIVPAPKTAEELERAILNSTFKLVASQLALRNDLRPVSAPDPAEKPEDSLRFRVTRLAWKGFAESLGTP